MLNVVDFLAYNILILKNILPPLPHPTKDVQLTNGFLGVCSAMLPFLFRFYGMILLIFNHNNCGT